LAKFVGGVPFTSDRGGLDVLRTALVSGVALAVLAGLAIPADAATRRVAGYGGYTAYGVYGTPAVLPARRIKVDRREGPVAKRDKAEPKKDSGFGELPKGPQQIVVNIGTQKVTFYSNGVRVAQGPVATGMPGHPTPQGVFSIIEKDRYHHSNIYSGAPMPYMQRITWSGVALHEGPLPGYPASHGCIRMSHDFAMKLWPITKMGVRVIVSRHDVEPVDFQHAKLFVPKQKPPEPAVAMNGTTDGSAIRFAQAAPVAASDAVEAAPVAPKPAPEAVDESEAIELNGAAPVEMVKPVGDIKATEVAPPATTADETIKATGTVAPAAPAPLAPADLRKSVEAPAEPAKPAEVTPAAAQSSPAEATPVKPEPTVDPVKPAVPKTKAAEQPAKHSGQVAVFVSRKEKKIFVRQGTVPLFDMPISINEPDQPLGTHVFTAMAVTDNGGGMRWNLMTIPTDPVAMMEDRGSGRRKSKEASREAAKPVVRVPGRTSTAAEALERIQFPKEAIDRISELLIPGSSLVVSDTGLGSETGRGTEFIVLTR
jgi:lipoprotein-anchoring transpeptidase ErfK/SrfK